MYRTAFSIVLLAPVLTGQKSPPRLLADARGGSEADAVALGNSGMLGRRMLLGAIRLGGRNAHVALAGLQTLGPGDAWAVAPLLELALDKTRSDRLQFGALLARIGSPARAAVPLLERIPPAERDSTVKELLARLHALPDAGAAPAVDGGATADGGADRLVQDARRPGPAAWPAARTLLVRGGDAVLLLAEALLADLAKGWPAHTVELLEAVRCSQAGDAVLDRRILATLDGAPLRLEAIRNALCGVVYRQQDTIAWLLRKEDPELRSIAILAYALPDERPFPLQKPAELEAAVAVLATSEDATWRRRAELARACEVARLTRAAGEQLPALLRDLAHPPAHPEFQSACLRLRALGAAALPAADRLIEAWPEAERSAGSMISIALTGIGPAVLPKLVAFEDLSRRSLALEVATRMREWRSDTAELALRAVHPEMTEQTLSNGLGNLPRERIRQLVALAKRPGFVPVLIDVAHAARIYTYWVESLPEMVDAFAAHLPAADRERRKRLLVLFGLAGDKGAAALAGSIAHGDEEVRTLAIRGIGRAGYRPALDRVLARLTDEDAGVRAAALVAAGQLGKGSEAASRAVLARLPHLDRQGRITAAWALRAIGRRDDAVLAAVATMIGDADQDIAIEGVATALALPPAGARAEAWLAERFASEDATLRAAAVQACWRAGEHARAYATRIVAALSDREETVVELAMRAVVAVGVPRALCEARLRELAGIPRHRSRAEWTLRRLGGKQ